MSQSPRIIAAPRPYVLTFEHGYSYTLSASEAQTLLDEYPCTRFSRNAVWLRGDGAGIRSCIRPATLGGGPAFTRETPWTGGR